MKDSLIIVECFFLSGIFSTLVTGQDKKTFKKILLSPTSDGNIHSYPF